MNHFNLNKTCPKTFIIIMLNVGRYSIQIFDKKWSGREFRNLKSRNTVSHGYSLKFLYTYLPEMI